ncbi:MAG: GlsB/YeaQ/YmgE family stress response membrane protein [Acidimicrobiales bacterium]|jgi:uncharacterized membrane protein YeaQ/YmgE (transglycosylase-associated protein family)
MGVLGWIVVGLIAGGLARRATGSTRQGCLTTMVIGIVGGVLGGAIFNAIGGKGITDFGIWSILVAFVGACLLLFLMQALGLADKRR